jgi:sugar/nucleoside kinase (ribokinase family)
MSLLVTGSIGIDTVEAPWGKVVDALGGSSIYFAQAASFFAPVRLVGVVGEDCPPDFLAPLRANAAIDLAGLEVRAGSKTFRWHGRYGDDVNLRDTVSVQLNVLAERSPHIPPAFRDSRHVFLANTHPALQRGLLEQLDDPQFVVADTMDLWIANERPALMELIQRIDGFVLNDQEARQLAGNKSAVLAGLSIAAHVGRRRGDRNPRRGTSRRGGSRGGFLVVKKGEHGSLLFADGQVFALPSFPAQRVIDPTGAGDSFAGAMMGCLASAGKANLATLRRAIAYGTVTASFTLEDFSLKRLLSLTRADIDQRLGLFQKMLRT